MKTEILRKRFLSIALSLVITMIFFATSTFDASAATSDWAFKKLSRFGFSVFRIQPFQDGKSSILFSVYGEDAYDETYGRISGSGDNVKITLQDDSGKFREIYPKWKRPIDYGISNPTKYGSLKISGNTIRYRKINNDYVPYGKWYSAKLTSSTKYLRGDVSAPGFSSDVLIYFQSNPEGGLNAKCVPFLKKKNKSDFVSYVKNSSGWSPCGLNIKNGKVKAVCYDSALAG